MDITLLGSYLIPLIAAICLCIGYVLKNLVTTSKINRFIPLTMAVTGTILNIWINRDFTPEILLGGMFSGLASTGLYESFRNIISKS